MSNNIYRMEEPADAQPSTPHHVPPQPPTQPAPRHRRPGDDGEPPRPPQKKTNRTAIVVGAVIAVVVIGAIVWAATGGTTTEGNDNDSVATDTLEMADSVVEIWTDDDYKEDSLPPLEEPEAEPSRNFIMAGRLTDADEQTTSVALSLNMDSKGNINGVAQNDSTSYDTHGVYNEETRRLLLYEDGGGRYDGRLSNDGVYAGTYRSGGGNTLSFSFKIH